MFLIKKLTMRFSCSQTILTVVTAFSVLFMPVISANAQTGSPVPGGWVPPTPSQPQIEQSNSAPVPGSDRIDSMGGRGFPSGVPAPASKYAQLPLSISDAKSRMQELNTMAAVARSQDVLESVNRLSEWLGDMCDAHNKMAISFSKHEQMKNQALAERQAVQKFSQVRNQAQLLKAQLLINQHRYPEALTPLVDIVIAEPLTPTGLSAYRKLKEMGFSEDAINAPEASLGAAASGSSPMGTAPATANTQGMATVEVAKHAPAAGHKNPKTAAAAATRKQVR
jgi:hypothetical protein